MKIKSAALIELAEKNGWSIPFLADELGIDYTYLFRILKGEKNGGSKVFSGLYQLCNKENLNIEDYIFLDKPLSVNNGKEKNK